MSIFEKKNIRDIIKNQTGFQPRFESLEFDIAGRSLPLFVGEFWTARQRQTHSLHGISYRACFKAELPRLFVAMLSRPGQTVFDPFSGRGTTALQAALMGRPFISNDINPLSKLLSEPRCNPPELAQIEQRLRDYIWERPLDTPIDLSMFYHRDTLGQLLNLRSQLQKRSENDEYDSVDAWIRMVATNRLSGHSPGFFSVYTLPPNQATSPERQKLINEKRQQVPPYRDVPSLILKKSRQLLKQFSDEEKHTLDNLRGKCQFIHNDSRDLKDIDDDRVTLTITSPPFLNVVQYASDNWLRCWFNHIDADEIQKKITVTSDLNKWTQFIGETISELYRITRSGGHVAFEVGEVRNGSVELEKVVAECALKSGFELAAIFINQQQFTKTANIWGVANNQAGTNTNRIVVMRK
jgi:hypothetical protein